MAWPLTGSGEVLRTLWRSFPSSTRSVSTFSCANRASTPGRRRARRMFQMMGVFAEFERAITQERIRAGLARARSEDKRLGRRRE
jgi:DNA invertase Pin-like site-specific DNA recombinase